MAVGSKQYGVGSQEPEVRATDDRTTEGKAHSAESIGKNHIAFSLCTMRYALYDQSSR